jgi:peroxiredoxin/uncharacterized membrane protein YphA (DoxX/SURF4 family)
MDAALLIARLVLAAIFLVAGLAKLADRAGSSQGILNFGLPPAVARPLAIILPLAEVAIGVVLLPAASAWWGSVGSLVLLSAVTAGIGLNLAHHRKPDCHCFGQLHSEPVGWQMLARSVVLTIVAGVLVFHPPGNAGPSPEALLTWFEELTVRDRVELLLAAFVFGLLAYVLLFMRNLRRQQEYLAQQLGALEAKVAVMRLVETASPDLPSRPSTGMLMGSPAPPFQLAGLDAEIISLDALLADGKPALLAFVDLNCGSCVPLLPHVSRWQREHASELTVVVISRGSPEENRARAKEHDLTQVLVQLDGEVTEAYQAHRSPSAVLVMPDGLLGSPLAQGEDQIRALVTDLVGENKGAPTWPAIRVG